MIFLHLWLKITLLILLFSLCSYFLVFPKAWPFPHNCYPPLCPILPLSTLTIHFFLVILNIHNRNAFYLMEKYMSLEHDLLCEYPFQIPTVTVTDQSEVCISKSPWPTIYLENLLFQLGKIFANMPMITSSWRAFSWSLS